MPHDKLYTFYTLDYQQQELLVFEGECQLLSHGKHLLRKAVYELFGHFVSIVLFLRDPEKHNTYFNPGDYTVSILKIYILKPFTDSIYDIIWNGLNNNECQNFGIMSIAFEILLKNEDSIEINKNKFISILLSDLWVFSQNITEFIFKIVCIYI